MRRMSTVLLALGLSLLMATPAMASLADRLIKDFADDGALDACKYSAQELGQVKGLIANDTNAYEPDFKTAVDAMIEKRAQGFCAKKKTAAPTSGSSASSGPGAPVAPAGGGGSAGTPSSGAGAAPGPGGSASSTPGPAVQPAPAPLIATDSIVAAARQREDDSAPPVPVIVLAILGTLLVLGGLALGAARWTGWEPAWAERARHAAAEAGWRASSTWAEFTDFVRLGR